MFVCNRSINITRPAGASVDELRNESTIMASIGVVQFASYCLSTRYCDVMMASNCHVSVKLNRPSVLKLMA